MSNSNPYHPFRFSRTGLRGLKASATLTLNDRIRAMMAEGKEIYHLGFGESRFPVHPLLARALRDNVHRRSYLPALGIPELRETVAEFYQSQFGLEATAERVVIGPGSKALLYASMLALDSEVILPTPAWVSYEAQARLASRPTLSVPMDPRANYRLDVERLREAIQAARKQWRHPDLLVINTPHNPTGTMMSVEDVRALTDFARDQEMMILSDEIYSLVTPDIALHTSPGQFYPEGTVVLGGLSKHMSLGGWRFGVALLPSGPAGEALARAIQAIAGCTWSCVAAPVQYAALEAYRNGPEIEAYVHDCARMHLMRTRYLYEALDEFGFSCPEPQGAFYLYPSFAKWRKPLAARGIHTCQDLSLYLLENYDLAILPGSSFGDDPQALALRLSTSFLDAESDEQAQELVTAFSQSTDPDCFIQEHHPRLQRVIERLGDFATEMEEEL